ncbi:phosphoribosylglycinamide synthetase ATP-grasp (A) domain protein [Legionella gratiana]|uniref:Phosphoribosylglycinamide synthetase ATP-grasp (A) domain protein n=1 Tax=Legionella gratiana TaxID=45066 RepID=A0A378JF13_9GAMM|nr:ATP-grasp domain-containing protein [Legionella gratiana]KTD13416.1 phosphoribosylglycinamide synthetase ATP-grasp (A) domain protein [Legionella gratiana]STX46494.1 phosphoribosylglycinamide synthetase ATP-grasp (A) domain protein [Legionella gratiana]
MSTNLISYTEQPEFIELIVQEYKNFDLTKKTILFIEPYGAVISLLKRGLEKKYNIIVLTAHCDFRVVPDELLNQVTMGINIDTANNNSVLELAGKLQQYMSIDAVIPGFEYFVPIASRVSTLLKVPGIDCKRVLNLRRKDLMRTALNKAGLNIPRYYLITCPEDINKAIGYIGFPAICKPIDAAGSVHVKKVENIKELLQAANRILKGNDVLWGHKLSNSLLLEEYIDGKEYSLEGVVQDAAVIHFSITEKFVSDQSEFIEIGHIVNVPMEPALHTKIQNYIAQVIKILGADNCPFHAEVRLRNDGEPVLMEIAARLAGDKIGDLLCLSRDINYFDYVYAVYLGIKLPLVEMKNNYAGIRFFYRPHVDMFTTVTGMDAAKLHSIEDIAIYYKANVAIPEFPKPLRRLGHVIAKSDDYNKLSKMLNDIDSDINFN